MDLHDDPNLIPSHFGRGWIPAGRDIGIPGDALNAGGEVLPETGRGTVAEGDGGGGSPEAPWSAEGPLHHAPHGPPPRAGEDLVRHNAWTPERKLRFLEALSTRGHVRAACALVGLSAEAAYKLRRRDALFAAAWDAALVLARGAAEQVLATRAIDGVAEDIYYRGELVGRRVRHDARLLLAHLARLDARAAAPLAEARAERFDELLALVAGAVPPSDLAADPAPGPMRGTVDPLLPPARARFVEAAARRAADAAREAELFDSEDESGDEAGYGDAMTEEEEEIAVDRAVEAAAQSAAAAARIEAGARWDAWRGDAWAVADGEVAPAAGPPPMEYKSLDGPGAGPGPGAILAQDRVNRVNRRGMGAPRRDQPGRSTISTQAAPAPAW